MQVFLCGGGAAEQTHLVNAALYQSIQPRKPLLYIPLALEEAHYDSCARWIHTELSPFGITNIHMVRSFAELMRLSFSDFSCLFIGDGNTFRLLSLLKSSGANTRLEKYLTSGGVVAGGSAGAIIFSKDIHCADYADENTVALADTKGLEILPGYDFACHFGSGDRHRCQLEINWLTDYSIAHNPVIALREDAHLCIADKKVTLIGPGKAYLFQNGILSELSPGPLRLQP